MCGLATFTSSLRSAFAINRGSTEGLDVIELIDGFSSPVRDRAEVMMSVDPADPFSLRMAADRVSFYDSVILQHEYGIWGPDMGLPVIDFVERVETGLITTLHTLLPDPSRVQEKIIDVLADRSDYLVVPSHASEDLLAKQYGIDSASIVVIPHGTNPFLPSVARLRALMPQLERPPRLLTWGLIGPGKGLEWSLRAVHLLKSRYEGVRYTIAGKTHPKVLRHEGERYRRRLQDLVAELGLQENVELVDDYVSETLLRDLLLDTTIVVLPYDSSEQIVSGVLVEAVAANTPVVATAFPHALELANQGAASVVPHQNPQAIADAVTLLLEVPEAWEQMTTAQWKIAPGLEWESVALDYGRLVESLIRPPVPARHVSPVS